MKIFAPDYPLYSADLDVTTGPSILHSAVQLSFDLAQGELIKAIACVQRLVQNNLEPFCDEIRKKSLCEVLLYAGENIIYSLQVGSVDKKAQCDDWQLLAFNQRQRYFSCRRKENAPVAKSKMAWQQAPKDQRQAGPWLPKQSLLIASQKKMFETALPSIVPQLFVLSGPYCLALQLQADTLCLWPEAGCGMLVYRNACELGLPSLEDLEVAMVVLRENNDGLDLPGAMALIEARLGPDCAVHLMNFAPLLPNDWSKEELPVALSIDCSPVSHKKIPISYAILAIKPLIPVGQVQSKLSQARMHEEKQWHALVLKERSIDETFFVRCFFMECKVQGGCFKHCAFENTLFVDNDWSDCQFVDCQFIRCQFQTLSWENCVLEQCFFDQCDLERGTWQSLSLIDTQWQKGSLTWLTVEHGRWCDTQFHDMHFEHVQLNEVEAERVNFNGGSMTAVDALGLRLVLVNWMDVSLSQVTFEGGDFKQVNFDCQFDLLNHCQWQNVRWIGEQPSFITQNTVSVL